MSSRKEKYDLNVDYDEETGYIHDHCTSRGFPIGGIGTGGFSVFTDGGLGKFRTNHNWFKSIEEAEYPRGSFWAVWVQSEGKKVAKILRRDFQAGKEFSNVESIDHAHFRGTLKNWMFPSSSPSRIFWAWEGVGDGAGFFLSTVR